MTCNDCDEFVQNWTASVWNKKKCFACSRIMECGEKHLTVPVGGYGYTNLCPSCLIKIGEKAKEWKKNNAGILKMEVKERRKRLKLLEAMEMDEQENE